MICDHVSSVGGISNVVVDSALLASVASARQSYMLHLNEQKKRQEETAASWKRKGAIKEIEEAKKKKKLLAIEVEKLTESADEFAVRAGSSRDLTWVTKSNSLRRTAREKVQAMNTLQQSTNKKADALKV